MFPLAENLTANDEPSDEALMAQLAADHQEAIVPLLVRYGPRVLNLAAAAVDRPAAEEIVQDVFVAVWRGAATFDPQPGKVRDWLLQITRNRIANELRRRGRRPDMGKTADEVAWSGTMDRGLEPPELVWRDFRRTALRDAVDSLPAKQRQVLSLAFFDELTHEQIASTLNVPLGTAKTRVRSALSSLRTQLTPLRASLLLWVLLVTGLLVVGLVYRQNEQARQFALEQRALWLVTSSDIVPLRLEAASGVDPKTHGSYRARTGEPLAVFTFSNFPPAAAGHDYRVWARNQQGWLNLGVVPLDAAGNGRLVIENLGLLTAPAQLEVTSEPIGGLGREPSGEAVIAWPPAK
jgi:RNA polymerase sigma factor (sigma-70 family)